MSNYKILKIPISKEKSVFYYYKQYVPKSDSSSADLEKKLVTLPLDKTIYVCHF